MLKSLILRGFSAAILLCALNAQAENEVVPSGDIESDAIVIDGDKLELHLDRELHAIGNASITRGKQTILGDDIDYDVQSDELHVTGNASIEIGSATLTGPGLHMQLSEGIGEMHDASITMNRTIHPTLKQNSGVNSDTFSKNLDGTQDQQVNRERTPLNDDLEQKYNTSNPEMQDPFGMSSEQSSDVRYTKARGDAKTILFEGQDKKKLKDARYTTCETGVDDWYIKAKEINLNDYTSSGVAKNAYIEFKGVPLLYTPWISFSYNNQRESGLLTPTYGTTTRSGFELDVPFYWNIAPNMDATLATRVLSKRGVQLQGEFRYLEESFSGVDNLQYLPNDNLTSTNRYYVNLKHQQNFGNGWTAGYSFEKVSDNQYFSDLSTHIVTTSLINLPQQFNVNYADDVWNFNAIAQKFQTLDNLSYPYERLPQLTLNGSDYFGDVKANLYSQLVQFGTNNSALVLPTGTRLSLYPSISLPMARSYGYITPKIGINYTNYNLNNIAKNLDSQTRTLPIFSLDSGLYFDRDFKVADRAYSQTLEPRLFYLYVPNKDQSNIPIFDTGEADLNFGTLFNENQFTGNDRINNANQLSLALTTRLIESDTGISRLSASIGQRYYFVDQLVGLPGVDFRKSNSSDIIAGLSTNLRTKWNVEAFWQYNTNDARSVRTTLTSRFNPEPGKALNLSYSYRENLTVAGVSTGINQFDLSGQWPISPGWSSIGRINYSLLGHQNIETLAGVEYNAGCWQARSVIQRVSTATANANYALFFQLDLGGLASIGSNPLSVIKRSIPGYANTGLIPNSNQQPYNE